MRVAIFGGGSIGSRHAANARALGHEVTVIDTDANVRRRITDAMPDVRAFGLLGGDEQKPDAVIVATPAHTHEAVAEALLVGGFRGPLFCEKPISLTSDAPVFRAWPHKVQMVGYNWRFHPYLQVIRVGLRFIASLHFDCRTDMRAWPGRQYAAPLLECSHEIDLARALLGHPQAFVAGELSEGGAWVQMIHPAGDSLVDVRWHAATPSRKVNAFGRSQGQLLSRPFLTVYPSLTEGLDASYVGELRHFFDCIEQNRTPDCTFGDGLAVVEIVEQARRMAA